MNQGKLEVVKQKMARVNVDILGISELKWTGMGEFNSDDHCIYYCWQESLRRNGAIKHEKRKKLFIRLAILLIVIIICGLCFLFAFKVSLNVYYCGQESLRRNGVAIRVNKSVRNAVLGCNLKNNRMISVYFQGKPFNIMIIQVYAPKSNAEEAEVEEFYEDL